MSTLIVLSQPASSPPGVHLAAAAGILDWLTAKNAQTQSVLRALAVTLGILFVIWQAVSSRGAMARVIIAIISSGVFIWGVWSVTDIKDRVGQEVGGLAPPAAVQLVPGVAHADLLPLRPPAGGPPSAP